MSFNVSDLTALEILDSRARPTLAVTVRLADGTTARAGVPSGASTGSREAVELRDGDLSRFGGGGVLKAVANVNVEIADLLRSRPWESLAEADQAMISLDGSPNKRNLGANALVGVSMALARALAASAGTPLWRWLAPQDVTPSLPVPHFNVLNGGVHAPNALDFQEFMVAPLGAPSMAEAVRAGAEVYAALRRSLASRKLSTGLGDEGGFAPEVSEPEEVLQLLVEAIGDAGYKAGADGVSIALDLAASEFRQPDGRYLVAGDLLSSGDLIDRLAAITRTVPRPSDRGRTRRGRRRGLDHAHQPARRRRRTGGRRHLLHQPGDHLRRHQPRHRQRLADQAQPDRHRHRDPGGDGGSAVGQATGSSCRIVPVRPRTASSPTSRSARAAGT